MAGRETISAQITPELKEWIVEDAEEMDISLSEWLHNAIDAFIDDGSSDDLTFEELDSMTFDELSDFVEEYELDLDPDDYEDGLLVSARVKLRDAICDELEIEEEPEEA